MRASVLGLLGNFGEKLVLERPFCLWRIGKGTPVAPTVSVRLTWAPPNSRGRGTASQQAWGLVKGQDRPFVPSGGGHALLGHQEPPPPDASWPLTLICSLSHSFTHSTDRSWTPAAW